MKIIKVKENHKRAEKTKRTDSSHRLGHTLLYLRKTFLNVTIFRPIQNFRKNSDYS